MDLLQMLDCVLMDYVDEYAVVDVALFSARCGYLGTVERRHPSATVGGKTSDNDSAAS